MRAQQTRFNAWRYTYNNERPHEGIGMQTPGDLYTASPRAFPDVMPKFEYAQGVRVTRVRPNGCIRWKGAEIFISETLIGEQVGLDHVDERLYALYVGMRPVAILDEETRRPVHNNVANQLLKELNNNDKV